MRSEAWREGASGKDAALQVKTSSSGRVEWLVYAVNAKKDAALQEKICLASNPSFGIRLDRRLRQE
jgi:hypothetical protein